MSMSEGLTELKYQESLLYQEVATTVSVHSDIINNVISPQVGCLLVAILISLVMGCCALVFMPSPRHHNQR
ncbi:MAG: hypothetical protein AAF821_20075 [Cyanobacteria bacterium P01_D01_bin.156]